MEQRDDPTKELLLSGSIGSSMWEPLLILFKRERDRVPDRHRGIVVEVGLHPEFKKEGPGILVEIGSRKRRIDF